MSLGRRGSFLPVATTAVVFMVVLFAGIFALLRAQVRQTVYQARELQAQSIAEAGLEDALNKVLFPPVKQRSYTKAFAGGYFEVVISTDLAPWIESRGYSAAIPAFGRASRVVRAQALFAGFYNFADSTFTVNWPMTAYDSAVSNRPSCTFSATNYSGLTSGRNGCYQSGDVLGNDSVVTAPNGYINGAAFYADAASTAPAAATVAGPVMLVSSATVDVMDASVYVSSNDNNASRIRPFSAYSTSTMVLNVDPATGNVQLSSGTYYFKGLFVSSRTLQISLDRPDQEVNIYLAGPLYVSPQGAIEDGTSVNSCGRNGGGCRATNVHIYGQGGSTITLSGYSSVAKNENATYLDVYCPGDAVVVNQRLLGRVIGRSVRITNPYGGSNRYPVFLFDMQFGFTEAQGARWVSGSWSMGH